MAKRTPVVQIDEDSSGEQGTCGNSRDREVLEFWERRSGRKLSLTVAREMQSNVEGLIGLLAQWARKDCAEASSVAKLREQHDAAKG